MNQTTYRLFKVVCFIVGQEIVGHPRNCGTHKNNGDADNETPKPDVLALLVDQLFHFLQLVTRRFRCHAPAIVKRVIIVMVVVITGLELHFSKQVPSVKVFYLKEEVLFAFLWRNAAC